MAGEGPSINGWLASSRQADNCDCEPSLAWAGCTAEKHFVLFWSFHFHFHDRWGHFTPLLVLWCALSSKLAILGWKAAPAEVAYFDVTRIEMNPHYRSKMLSDSSTWTSNCHRSIVLSPGEQRGCVAWAGRS